MCVREMIRNNTVMALLLAVAIFGLFPAISTAFAATEANLTTNNKSGFLALPGGSRNTDGNFDSGGSGNWWSATEYNSSGAVARNLYYDYENLFWNSNYKSCGFSVRLVKD